jgi:hypothetical protein
MATDQFSDRRGSEDKRLDSAHLDWQIYGCGTRFFFRSEFVPKYFTSQMNWPVPIEGLANLLMRDVIAY